MPATLLPKSVWKNANGASNKAKRLHLVPDQDGFFTCPVSNCDSNSYRSKRGCRKHVTLCSYFSAWINIFRPQIYIFERIVVTLLDLSL